MGSVIAARHLPYGFARANQLLAAAMEGDVLEVWISERPPLRALSELARTSPLRLRPVRKSAEEIDAAITRAYAHNEGSAAAVVDEVEGDLDLTTLMQDIPRIEDLLEADDDAPRRCLGHSL